MVLLATLMVLLGSFVAYSQQSSGDGPSTDAPEKTEPANPKKARPHPAHKTERAESDTKKSAQTVPSAPPVAQGATPQGTVPAQPKSLADVVAAGASQALDVAARLKTVGAGACANSIDAAAAQSMIGVTQSNTLSTWSDQMPVEKHAASVVIGQKYSGNAAVPYGATAVIASPNASGSCDTTVVQVVSSPLSCADVKSSLAKGKKTGDIAGLNVIQSGKTNTILMPTGTNTCVIIDYKAMFAP